MFEIMYDVLGIGLVVLQVGILNWLIVMDVQCDFEVKLNLMVLINFEVIWELEECNVYEEGCLLIFD